jgi:DNA-binding CsgD family transcriptional regulator
VLRVPLDERARERILAETGGNPLALLELPRGLTPAQLAGGFGLLDTPGLSGRIEDSFRRRLAALPADTQRLMLVAAAEPIGDPVLVWRAAGRFGIGPAAAAETDGLLAIGTRVTFRHPLVRSAVYRAASPNERQSVHRALADATDPEVDPDRRAWHLAQATPGPDEDVASELERSAGRAQARGGLAAAAAFLERAAALTPEPARRAQRALAAAQAEHQAGAPDVALGLLAVAEAGPLDELQRARVDLLRAQVAFVVSRGREAPLLLLGAAKRLEPLDLTLARDTYLDALGAALMFVGPVPDGGGASELVKVARAVPPAPEAPRAADLLLDGLAVLLTEGHAAGASTLKRAVSAFRSDDVSREEGLRWLWWVCHIAIDLWDDESWEVLSTRHLRLCREAGALTAFHLATDYRIGMHVHAGELAAASSLRAEAEAVGEATRSVLPPYPALMIAASRGREADLSKLTEASMNEMEARGEGTVLAVIRWASAVLYNGLSRYEEALAAAQEASAYPPELLFPTWALVELIESGARCAKPEPAAGALRRLSEHTQASGTDWALGIEARSRALLSVGEIAEALYREAVDRLERTRARAELARAHLLYGEWLRRERRRLDAREQLRTAHDLFSQFGMEAFGERARVELVATGEHARKRTVDTRDDLTPQEAQICRLAAHGATNQEIAAQMFISPSTVDYHLRKAFRKLGVNSRRQLKQHVLEPGARADPAAREY